MEELVYFIKIHIKSNPITILLSKDLEAQRGKLQYIAIYISSATRYSQMLPHQIVYETYDISLEKHSHC